MWHSRQPRSDQDGPPSASSECSMTRRLLGPILRLAQDTTTLRVGAAAARLVSSLNTALGRALSAASGAPPAGVIRLRPRAVGADGRPAAWRVKTGSGGAPSTLRHRSAEHCAARRSAATWRIARSAVLIPTWRRRKGWPAGTGMGGDGARGCLEHPRRPIDGTRATCGTI